MDVKSYDIVSLIRKGPDNTPLNLKPIGNRDPYAARGTFEQVT